MLDYYFTDRYAAVLRGMREGAAGPVVDKLAAELRAAGLAREGSQRALRGAAHFIEWSCGNGAEVAALDEAWLARFEEHLAECRCPRGRRDRVEAQMRGARMVLAHIAGHPVVRFADKATEPLPPLVESFDVWSRDRRGLSKNSRDYYLRYVRRFVEVRISRILITQSAST
jgi:hypothetical protein